MKLISLVLALLLALMPLCALCETLTLYSDPYAMESTYRRLIDGWAKSLEAAEADVVFFGDSLTLGGAWEEYFPDHMVINLGVVGDVLYGMQLRTALVRKILPSKCFVLGGVNNLSYREPVDQALGFYAAMLDELSAISDESGMTVYVQSVLPVNENICGYGIKNADVCALNDGIRQLASERGMEYIDVYSMMHDETGNLLPDYTVDGLHLSESGYITWCEVLQPYLDE